jgi:hypothetical protein
MNISTLLSALGRNVAGVSAHQTSATNTVTAGQALDPAATTVSADVYHGSDGATSQRLLGQSGVAVYAQVLNGGLDEKTAWSVDELMSNDLGKASGNLRYRYEDALTKLSPQLQHKDWRFSVSDGQLVFSEGKDKLSEQDRTNLRNAFTASGVATAASQVANTVVKAIDIQRKWGLDSTTSAGIGKYDVTTSNFSDIVDLRSYLTSQGPGQKYDLALTNPKDYSLLYDVAGGRAMMDQIAAKAIPKYAAR